MSEGDVCSLCATRSVRRILQQEPGTWSGFTGRKGHSLLLRTPAEEVQPDADVPSPVRASAWCDDCSVRLFNVQQCMDAYAFKARYPR